MSNYRIFTDSASNLSETTCRTRGIRVIALRYLLHGVEYRGYADPAAPELPDFYNQMRGGALVQTSMINTQNFQMAFSACLASGYDVLYVSLSSGISGCFQSARMAAEELREQFPERRIELVDTCAASLAEGLCVLRASDRQQAGASLEEAAQAARDAAADMNQFFMVDDLEYLKRGGRVSPTVAKIGALLNIKPILWGDEAGTIILRDKVRGRKKALAALAEAYRTRAADPNAPIAIAHADAPAEAEALIARLRELGQQGEILVECYEPVTGAHVGPGAVALFFFGHGRAQ